MCFAWISPILHCKFINVHILNIYNEIFCIQFFFCLWPWIKVQPYKEIVIFNKLQFVVSDNTMLIFRWCFNGRSQISYSWVERSFLPSYLLVLRQDSAMWPRMTLNLLCNGRVVSSLSLCASASHMLELQAWGSIPVPYSFHPSHPDPLLPRLVPSIPHSHVCSLPASPASRLCELGSSCLESRQILN